MKKTIVALAVAAFAATSANAATVFNQDGTKVDVNGSFRALLVKAKDNRTDLGTGGSHFAFQASHDLGNGLSALGYAKVKLDDYTALDNLYAGLKFDGVGQLTFGKQATNGDDVALAGYNYDLGLGVSKVVDGGKKVVKFTSAEFEGFKFGLDYVFDATTTVKTAPESKDRTFVLAGFYDRKFGDVGFKFNLGYSHAKKHTAALVTTTKAYTVASEVSYGPAAFAIDFSQEKMKGSKTAGFLLGAKYQVNDDVKVYANYKNEKTKAQSVTTKKETGYGLGVGYKLHKNVETFLEGAKYRTKAGTAAATTNNKVQVGFRVHF